MLYPPNVLTIAGSDSGGGAGIQADLKTFTTLGVYGMTVITALTAQNGTGVFGIIAPEPEFVGQQLDAVMQGFPIHAAKTGMLFSSEIIRIITQKLQDKSFPLVVDPVCVSQSGHKLIKDDALDTMKELLFPIADLITPNRPEAEALTGILINNTDDIALAGEKLLQMGAKVVLIKGGHYDEKPILVTDWLIEANREPRALQQAHIDTINNHGTGCCLSAAIAAYLAKEQPISIAITKAHEEKNENKNN